VTTDAVAARFDALRARNADALRLAELCAFAVRLEPALLRTVRQRFLPGTGPAAELDLWHSALVQARGAGAALVEPEALARLRDTLAADPQRRAVYEATLGCFDGGSAAAMQRFEIELNALPVLDAAVADAAIDQRFGTLLAALREGDAEALGAARWVLQAAPRWHPRVRATGSAWAALLAASALLEGRRLAGDTPPPALGGALLAQALPPILSKRRIGVVLETNRLVFLAPADGLSTVEVPNTAPALLLLEQGSLPVRVVEARAGTEIALVESAGELVLRSLTGEGWRVETVAVEDSGTVAEPPVTQQASAPVPARRSFAPDEPRRVWVLVGNRRQDLFDVLARGLAELGYEPAMPEAFWGERGARPAVEQALRQARFVVVHLGLPVVWAENLMAARDDRIVVPIADDDPGPVWWPRLASMAGVAPRVRFDGPEDLARRLEREIVGAAEALRERLRTAASPRRLTVYLSSTHADLQEHREAVSRELAAADHEVFAPETGSEREGLFAPDDIARCDAVVCLVGWRYGYVPPDRESNPEGLSVVELEWREAVRVGVPVLAFLAGAEAMPPSSNDHVTGDGRKGERIEAFRARLTQRHVVASFDNLEQLRREVLRAVADLPDPLPERPVPWLDTDLSRNRAIEAALRWAREAGPPRLREALGRAVSAPDAVQVYHTRGPAMLSVSEGGVSDLEADQRLKRHEMSNHVFADVLGGATLRWPVLWFLSPDNEPGMRLETVEAPAAVIALGPGYSLLEAALALDAALARQGVELVRSWFLKMLREQPGADTGVMARFTAFVTLPSAVRRLLESRGPSIVGRHVMLVHDGSVRAPELDPDAVAQMLGLPPGDYGVLRADARRSFQFRRGDRDDDDFALPQDLGRRLAVEEGLRALIFRVWFGRENFARIAPDGFAGVETVLAMVPAEDAKELAAAPAWRDFERLEIAAADGLESHGAS